MATWDEIASRGEALVKRVETLITDEKWDELATSVWSIDDVPESPITDVQRDRILSLMEVAGQLVRDVAIRMTSTRTDLEGLPMVRKVSAAYLTNGTS